MRQRVQASQRALRSAGNVPLWLSLGLCALGLAWITRDLTRKAEERGVALIDPRRARLQTRAPWVLPEWEEELATVLAEAGTFRAHDREVIAALAAEVRALPFVSEVLEPEVVWPDGLRLDVRLRAPVACVLDPNGAIYLPVAADGMVLPGRASSPHRAHGGWLPVLAPLARSYAPGQRLSEPSELAALAVASSLWNWLSREAREQLGRVRIDASSARAPDGLVGGIVLDLEQRRRIVFGRAPDGAPLGELPVACKWAHVERALRDLVHGAEWDTYDVRWDRAVALQRPADLTQVARAAAGAGLVDPEPPR